MRPEGSKLDDTDSSSDSSSDSMPEVDQDLIDELGEAAKREGLRIPGKILFMVLGRNIVAESLAPIVLSRTRDIEKVCDLAAEYVQTVEDDPISGAVPGNPWRFVPASLQQKTRIELLRIHRFSLVESFDIQEFSVSEKTAPAVRQLKDIVIDIIDQQIAALENGH